MQTIKKKTKGIAAKLLCPEQLVSTSSMMKKTASMKFRNARVSKKRAKKNLQSTQNTNENHMLVEIKEEVSDLETESLFDLASSLHRHDSPDIVSSSTGNQPISMQSLDEPMDATESLESSEYCSPDSTQLLDIVDSCAVKQEQNPEFESCDTAVQNEQLSSTFESSRVEVETLNGEANESLDAFEIEGECHFDVDGQETTLAKVDIKPSSETIGIIGCGPMAKAIICYLVKSKHILYAYNRTKEKLMELPINPNIVSSPSELVEKCDVILTCVSDVTAVDDIMNGPDGILEALELNPDKAYVEMSSLDPKTISKYAEEVNCRRSRYLTAQIGRSRPAAYMGCSLITASGDLNTFMRCKSAFAAFSTNVVYLDSGVETAPVLSIINSVIEGVSIINLADILLSIEKSSLPRKYLLDMVEFQPVQMALLRVAAINMLENRDLVFVTVKHVIKNILMALELKKSSTFGDEYLVTALQICKEVVCHYPEALDHDISCVYKLRSDYSAKQ